MYWAEGVYLPLLDSVWCERCPGKPSHGEQAVLDLRRLQVVFEHQVIT